MADNSTDNSTDKSYADYKLQYQIATLNVVLSTLVIFINIFHYCILTRKELRTISVFILMKGICICDIIYLITEFMYNGNVVRAYQRTDYCYEYDSWLIIMIECVVISSGESIQFSSVHLVVTMALNRSLSIIFPLNYTVEKVTSAKVTVRVMYSLIFVTFFWSMWPYYAIYVIVKKGNGACDFVEDVNATKPEQYGFGYMPDESDSIDELNTMQIYEMIVQEVVYAVSAILMIRSIHLARKKQKRMRNSNSNEEKKVNTTKLVLAMMTVFLVSQSYEPIITYVNSEIDLDLVQSHIIVAIKTALLIVHSSSHCIVTFLMSSQYRDTVRKVLGIQKKQNQVADAPTSMVTSAS